MYYVFSLSDPASKQEYSREHYPRVNVDENCVASSTTGQIVW